MARATSTIDAAAEAATEAEAEADAALYPLQAPALFIDTNLDTHIAMAVSPDATIADIKRKARIEHAVCLPDIGEINVVAMKVWRRGVYYHLSDSMPVRTAFDGLLGTWFLHMDVIRTADIISVPRNDTNATTAPSARKSLLETCSDLKLNDPLPEPLHCRDDSLVSGVSDKVQSPKSQVPSSVLAHTSCSHGEVLRENSGAIHSRDKSGKSALASGNRLNVVDTEADEMFCKGNRVPGSDALVGRGISVDQLKEVGKAKEYANPNDEAIDNNASTFAAKKEKPIKRVKKLEDHPLLLTSSEKKWHKKERKQENISSCGDRDEDGLKTTEAENVPTENVPKGIIVGNMDMLGEQCSKLLIDNLPLPEVCEKKRRKKKREVSTDCHNESDAAILLNANDNCKKSALGTGSSDYMSNKHGLALEKEGIEDNRVKALGIDNTDLGASISVKLPEEDTNENLSRGNHVGEDCEVPSKGNKRDVCKSKKKITKGDLPHYKSAKAELVNRSRKKINEENSIKAPASNLKDPATDPGKEVVLEEVSRLGKTVNIVPEVPSANDGRSSSDSRKKSGKAGLSKVKSSKDGNSEKNVVEEATTVGNPLEAGSSVPPSTNDKISGHREKKLVKAKQSGLEDPFEDVSPIAGSLSSAEQPLAEENANLPESGNERVNFWEALVPRDAQHGIVNTEGGHIIRESHKRKIQEGDSIDCDLVEPPKHLEAKQRRKSRKQITGNAPNVVGESDKRRESDVPQCGSTPSLQSLKSKQDRQTSVTNKKFRGIEEIKIPPLVEGKFLVDELGIDAPIWQKQIRVHGEESMKERKAASAASSESTAEDTPYNKIRYRVAVRKIPEHRLKKALNKSNDVTSLSVADNIFGDATSNSSEEPEAGNEKQVNKTVSDTSKSSIDTHEEYEETQVIQAASSQGVSPSSAHLLNEKELCDDDIDLSQPSNAAKKRTALRSVLRGSHSYWKAKITASQSQIDDAESHRVDAFRGTGT